MLTAVELEIELFCRGMRLDASCHVGGDARRIARTRAGLGSGLEIVIPSKRKPIWVNVPVVEEFTRRSPFVLIKRTGYSILDSSSGIEYPVDIPMEPDWYSRKTSTGVEMSRIGVMQGNYLAVYISSRCHYWSGDAALACKFCTTGRNVGVAENARKRVDDVVEVALAARDESGSIFTHFNTGYHFEDREERDAIHGLRQCEAYVKAVRERVGGFIGVQTMPVFPANYDEYDRLIDLGADHFSFCYEFEDPAVFAQVCPGKAHTHGQTCFFEAMEYTSKKLGRGRVSGEIIAGIESIEATKRGIDRIVDAGAFPTVCIFRPTIGSALEDAPPPNPEEMKEVFAYLYEACRRASLPVGILPIEVSLVVQPEEAIDLVVPNFATDLYSLKNWTLRQLARPYISWKRKPREPMKGAA